MEHNVLSNIPGIAYYPIFSLILFFTCFAGVIVWYFRADRKRLDVISQDALNEGLPIHERNQTGSVLASHQ